MAKAPKEFKAMMNDTVAPQPDAPPAPAAMPLPPALGPQALQMLWMVFGPQSTASFQVAHIEPVLEIRTWVQAQANALAPPKE